MQVYLLGVYLFLAASGADGYGDCSGAVETRWLEDGRRMVLTSDYKYVDALSVEWHAPRGSVVDGASIPRFLWSSIGGPFAGKYRKASVVHDVACDAQERTWDQVHRMFYDACRCSGVSPFKARLMYAAVYHFGPRWGISPAQTFALAMQNPVEAEVQLRQIAAYLREHPNVSIERIESLTPEELQNYAPEGDLDLAEPE